MAHLTVTEKEHWRDALGRRIARRVEAVRAQYHALFERIDREAHEAALEGLGLVSLCAELDQAVDREAELARVKCHLQRETIAAVRGVTVDDVTEGFRIHYGRGLPLPDEVAEAIRRREDVERRRLLAADSVGGEVARLEAEKERLLDTIWLATSPAQIRTLWSKVAALLGEEPTSLE